MPLDHRNHEFARQVSPGLESLRSLDHQMADARRRENRLRDQMAALERELDVYKQATRGIPLADLRRVNQIELDQECGYPHQNPRRCWVLLVENEG